jgi:hypothetical protein
LVPFRRIARTALLAATICLTVGATGVLATMTWQVPADPTAAIESGIMRPASPSLIMTSANAYINAQTARMALQSAPANAVDATSPKDGARGKDLRNLAFQQTCLKKVSKRRNAKLVRVPCSPLQDDNAATIATADAPGGASSAAGRQIQ